SSAWPSSTTRPSPATAVRQICSSPRHCGEASASIAPSGPKPPTWGDAQRAIDHCCNSTRPVSLTGMTDGGNGASDQARGGGAGVVAGPRGRPRSDRAHQAIRESARTHLTKEGVADLRLAHVAEPAGGGKATI